MDFIAGLSPDKSNNAIYTCMDKLTKLVKIIPCMVGDGGRSTPATAKLFFDDIIIPLAKYHLDAVMGQMFGLLLTP